MRSLLIGAVLAGILVCSFYRPGRTVPAASGPFLIDTLATGLVVPWDIVFTPAGDMLFTERPGRVRLYRSNKLADRPLLVVPDIEVKGKMGLLGMCLHPKFSANHQVYLAYNYRRQDQTFLRVMRYRLSADSLIDGVLIIGQIPGVFNHTGSRLVFGKDGKLYISTGDADVPRLAQDLKTFNGKILRLNEDGSIPADNPFIKNDTAKHEIWTYGHRNPQGLVFQPSTGYLYSSEHGPTGGDEINLIARGNNYGWPILHHRDVREGMMPPLLEFTPSIGPAEALFYSGKAFPEMKGDLLVGCMRGEAILRVRFGDGRIASYDFLLKKQFGRIRALAEGPDGYLYFSTSMVDPPESNAAAGDQGVDMLVRLRPSGVSSTAAAGSTQVTEVPGQAALFNPAAGTGAAAKAGSNSGSKSGGIRPAEKLYAQLCASCHGADLNGKEKVPSLADGEWLFGGSRDAIRTSISQGIVAKGMPAWEGVLSAPEIGRMVSFILKHKKAARK
jgi:glucose/arabinose dehydrogenase/cytochrome c5